MLPTFREHHIESPEIRFLVWLNSGGVNKCQLLSRSHLRDVKAECDIHKWYQLDPSQVQNFPTIKWALFSEIKGSFLKERSKKSSVHEIYRLLISRWEITYIENHDKIANTRIFCNQFIYSCDKFIICTKMFLKDIEVIFWKMTQQSDIIYELTLC